MALTSVTIEALERLSNILRQSVEYILESKVESFIWDDPVGLAFEQQYHDDFRPLTDKMIPQIDGYLQYLGTQYSVVSEYEEGTTLPIGDTGTKSSVLIGTQGLQGKKFSLPQNPREIVSDTCEIPKTGAQLADEYLDNIARNASNAGKRLNYSNYRSYTKGGLLLALAAGAGIRVYQTSDKQELGPYNHDRGAHAQWKNQRCQTVDGKKVCQGGYMLVQRDFLTDSKFTNDDVVEVFFHENEHRIQDERLGRGCLQAMPEYKGVSVPCIREISLSTKEGDISQECLQEFDDYNNHWIERDAREAGRSARKHFIKKYQESRLKTK